MVEVSGLGRPAARMAASKLGCLSHMVARSLMASAAKPSSNGQITGLPLARDGKAKPKQACNRAFFASCSARANHCMTIFRHVPLFAW